MREMIGGRQIEVIMADTCKSCRYRWSDGVNTTCRRYPPMDENVMWAPVVDDNWWCGEFKSIPQAPVLLPAEPQMEG